MPCGKTAGNSGNDDAGERMERKIEEETEGREEEGEYRLRQSFFNDNHFFNDNNFFNDNRDNGDNRRKT